MKKRAYAKLILKRNKDNKNIVPGGKMETKKCTVIIFLILLFGCENAVKMQDDFSTEVPNSKRNKSQFSILYNKTAPILTFHAENADSLNNFSQIANIEISCDIPNVDIYYTLDGEIPNPQRGKKYESTISIKNTTTIKAVAYEMESGIKISNVFTVKYTNTNKVAKPAVSVPAGDFWNTITVFITCDTEEANIYYTTDGTEPNPSKILYTADGIKIYEDTNLKIVAYKNGLEESEVISANYKKRANQTYTENKSGVMLQGFNWDSAPRGAEYNAENPNPKWFDWYKIMLDCADDIKNTFEYVWFAPPSKADTASAEGYAPTQLNNLNNCYGTEEELKKVIEEIKPAKAIADIVINHRAGTSDWLDFTNPSWTDEANNYTLICSDDLFFKRKMPDKYQENREASYTLFEAYRNLKHSNTIVQQGIYSWMNSVLKRAGFVGWRYDYVKGYPGKYVGYYNAMSDSAFSVGEYWPEHNYDIPLKDNADNWETEIKDWIASTSEVINDTQPKKSRAFDFVLKRNLNNAFGWYKNVGGYIDNSCLNLWNMSFLADSANLVHSSPKLAVTFVDNHDTGSTQQHWELKWENVPLAYTFILTHPGFPCVAWQHYFSEDKDFRAGIQKWQYRGSEIISGTDKTFREHIDYLINLRKTIGIEYDDKAQILEALPTNYVAKITGTAGEIIVKIGCDFWRPTGDGYAGNYPIYSGTNFAIWQKRFDVNLNIANENSETFRSENCKLFAWVWGGSHNNGEWIHVNHNDFENTFNISIYDNASGFLLVKCHSNVIMPDWDTANCISYKSSDITFVKGMKNYTVGGFTEYIPN